MNILNGILVVYLTVVSSMMSWMGADEWSRMTSQQKFSFWYCLLVGLASAAVLSFSPGHLAGIAFSFSWGLILFVGRGKPGIICGAVALMMTLNLLVARA